MQVNVDDWDELAASYMDQIGDDGDLWHRALIDPTVFQVLGPVAGQEVLDLACGNGYLSRRLVGLGAQITGVDASALMLARAQEREFQQPLGIRYQRADAAQLDMLADRSFDIVLCNMALMDIADAEGAIREAGRVLRPGGRFIASICHPCFDVVGASAWIVERPNPTEPHPGCLGQLLRVRSAAEVGCCIPHSRGERAC